VVITWEKLDLAQGDFIRIYDGENEESPMLSEYTSGAQPQEINATGGKVFIHFTTAPTSETAQGFLLNFKSNVVKNCDENEIYELTEWEGTFDDGSGENYHYPNSATCRWKILPKDAKSINITFNYFETEEGKDVVKIYDAKAVKLIATLSGVFAQDSLPAVTVPSGEALITFGSNQTVNAKGFELNYKASNVVAIEEQHQAVEALTVFPNPTSGELNISFSINNNDNINIEIYNMMGQNVYNERLTNFIGNYNKTINTKPLSKGVYFLKVTSSSGISIKKIIVN
jgi:hypothetical protein